MSQCRQVDDGDNQDSEIQVINYAYLICNSNKKCLKYRLDYIGSQNPIKCIDQTNIETANYGYFWKVTINKKARSVEFLHLLENQVIQADRDKKIFNDFQNKNSNRSDNQSYSNESEEEEYDGGSMSGSDESSDKDIKLGVKRFSNNEGRKLNMNNDESKLFKLEIDGDFDKVVEKLMEGNEFSVTTSNNVYLVYKDSGNGTEGCFKLVQNDDSINLNKFNFHKFHLAPVNNNHIDNISLVETIRKYLSLIKRFVKVFIKQKNSLKEYYSVYLQIKKLMKIIKQVLDDSYGPFSSLSSQKDDQKALVREQIAYHMNLSYILEDLSSAFNLNILDDDISEIDEDTSDKLIIEICNKNQETISRFADYISSILSSGFREQFGIVVHKLEGHLKYYSQNGNKTSQISKFDKKIEDQV